MSNIVKLLLQQYRARFPQILLTSTAQKSVIVSKTGGVSKQRANFRTSKLLRTCAQLVLGAAAALTPGTVLAQTQVNLDQLNAPDVASAFAVFKDHGDCTLPVVAPVPSVLVDGVTFTGGTLLNYPAIWDPYNAVMEDPHNTYATRVTSTQESGGTCSFDGWPGSQKSITFTFQHKVSNVNFRIHSGNLSQQCFTIQDNLGRSNFVSTNWGSGVDVYNTVAMKGGGISSVKITPTFCGPGQQWDYYIDHIAYAPGATLTFVDPVPDLVRNNGINTSAEALATEGSQVTGIAADGVARIVVRIAANFAGETINVALLNENGNASSSPVENGTLTSLQTNNPGPGPTMSIPLRRKPKSLSTGGPGRRDPAPGQLQLTVVDTSRGPMAFAVYQSPVDFSRSGADDTAQYRSVSIQVQSVDYPEVSSTSTLNILRPPVVLVHGLWGEPSNWTAFQSHFNNKGLFVETASYDDNQPTQIMYSDPPLSEANLSKIKGNSMGLNFNAPRVLDQIADTIARFRATNRAAAGAADVVAHSMGGVITRTLVKLSRAYGPESFGLGNIHKLITVGTPHVGTPIARRLINSTCVFNMMAKAGNYALTSVTVVGGGQIQAGAGDLGGDGLGGFLSGALNEIKSGNLTVPTAMIAGSMSSANVPPGAGLPVQIACSRDPLAQALSPGGWAQIFGGTSDQIGNSDGIVPVTSQAVNSQGNPTTPAATVPGVIHSEGTRWLGLSRPSELSDESTTHIPSRVFQLLNQSVKTGFIRLP